MLEDPEAFKARARLRAAYDPELAHGRPVVPAGVAADAMMASLMEWSADMPPFAAHFIGGFAGPAQGHVRLLAHSHACSR